MRLYKFSWFLYIVGSLLVFGSWVGIVSAGVGWFGWLIGMAGWAVGAYRSRPSEAYRPVVQRFSVADEIAKLETLHKDGVLTDMEFQREKAKILMRRDI